MNQWREVHTEQQARLSAGENTPWILPCTQGTRYARGAGSRLSCRVPAADGSPRRVFLPATTTVGTVPKSHQNRQGGFTLIELITVIVILGIIAVIGSQFIVSATESYRATQSRALLANTGRQAVERMTRQLRGALPYSVRLTNGGECVQFMPIAAAGFYLQPVSSTTATLTTSPFTDKYYSADYLVIGALSDNEIYSGSVRADITPPNCSDDVPCTTVGFPPHPWPRNSVSQRFYLVSNPQAFCIDGTQLRFYENLSSAGVDVNTASASELLARNVLLTTQPPFEVDGATANNNILVRINLAFAEGGESVDFFQEVSLRNVP